MTDLTDYFEESIMQWCFHGSAFDTAPGTLYIALHTDDPNATGDNTEPGDQNEVGASDYDRADVTVDGSTFTQGTNGTATTMENANEIAFGTATSDWGTVSHFSIWTSADGTGDCLWASDLSSSKTVNTDDEIRFQAGDLSAELD